METKKTWWPNEKHNLDLNTLLKLQKLIHENEENSYLVDEENYDEQVVVNSRNSLVDFVDDLLSQQREELIKKVKSKIMTIAQMKGNSKERKIAQLYWNLAIDDIINLLKE